MPFILLVKLCCLMLCLLTFFLFFLTTSNNSGSAFSGKSIRELTNELGLEKYADTLEANDVDLAALALLTQYDFTEMGITSIGAQRKLQAAAESLRGGQGFSPLSPLGGMGAPPIPYGGAPPVPVSVPSLRQPTPRDYQRPQG
ncbi:hypothetical protein T492DRAFT_838751 [Pavlovales sp. CCMP2436]|nr:hypothetical protein T492DRAFT_838751 [Pavlovales sp. CCMP2436]